MSEPILSTEELFAWNEKTSTNWRNSSPPIPNSSPMPCDIAGTKTVAELLQHIVAVELRYAERLAGPPRLRLRQHPLRLGEAIYATHDRAINILHQSYRSDLDWDQPIEFMTRT